ncbi:cytochrome P450 6B2-like [Leguminivora glycinivorella]|uniref:cytochrome P450 6B2-like n=1 Tax=Leguminivora glycinivorella TaxID=1035111 RepID=UPI00200D1F96|nr:cytochrome P450 6B2-like [Leguminivora glycinivorella]
MIALLLISATIVALSILYFIANKKLNYWEKRGVPFEKPVPIFGNFAGYILLKSYWGKATQKLCQKFQKEPYFGVYYGTEPALVVQDPELIKLITTKDFYYFSSREISNYTHLETITQNLFFTQGNRWKVLRQNLTPLFSSSKMKNMFHLIENCTKTFENLLDEETNKCPELDIRATAVRFAMDSITSCAFGINSDVMGKNCENNPFKVMGDVIFELTNIRGFKIVARAIWPYVFYGLGFRTFPDEIDTFFNRLLSDVFKERNYKPSTRNDFVDLMLNFKGSKNMSGDSMSNVKSESEKKERIHLEVTDDLLIAQCMVFFAAGFETSASVMCFTLYELAKNPEKQPRLFEEVDAYLKKTGGKVTYDCLTELPYMEACVNEAMRLYPVLGVLAREVVEPYTLPSGLVLEKGMRVHLPVYHLHHNADLFPEPEKYRPERFMGEEKQNIVPYTYMPFGEGPRICIGMRFARMQMFAGLVTLLKNYSLRLAPGMPREVDFEPRTFVTQAKNPIRLTLTPRSCTQRMVA